MSAVIVVRGKNKFVVGHDSCVCLGYEDGSSKLVSRPSVRKLIVWPTFALGYCGDIQFPYWADTLPRLQSIDDLWKWSGPRPQWFMGLNIVALFPSGKLYRINPHHLPAPVLFRGKEARTPVFSADDETYRPAADVGCWCGDLHSLAPTQASVRRALEQGRNSTVRAPFRTYELPFGKEFPPPYGPRGFKI